MRPTQLKTVSHCVLCSGRIKLRGKGLIAPFVATRIWGRPPFHVDIMECVDCDFIFCNPRLEPDEEQRLYANYRSEEYRKMRHSSEPWYTEKFNSGLSKPEFMAYRQKKLTELLADKLSLVRPSILDFGGYRGELVKGLIADGQPWVYDISQVTPLPGVGQCVDLAACKAGEFDLILNSNVLEHVGFPRVLMDEITSVAAPGTLAYIEVPCESPFDWTMELRRAVQLGVLAVTRPLVALSLLKPGMFHVIHEHINFYTPRSLSALMATSGWTVLAAEHYSIDGPFGKGLMAWCLAKK